MGMIGEMIAEQTAKKLEKIILNAINNSRWGDVRSAVKGFVKEELVEWYYQECDETYGAFNPNSEILKLFPRK